MLTSQSFSRARVSKFVLGTMLLTLLQVVPSANWMMSSANAVSPAFTCSATFYQASAASTLPNIKSGSLYSSNLVSGALVYTKLTSNTDTSPVGSMNGIGYNTADNYIYGIVSNKLYKIDAVGATSQVFDLAVTTTVAGDRPGSPAAGDFVSDNKLLVYSGSFFLVDVTTGISKKIANTGTAVSGAWDFTVIGTKAYGMSGATLYKMDLANINAGTPSIAVTTVSVAAATSATSPNIAQIPSGSFGAAYTDFAQNGYFYDNNTGNVFEIDATSLVSGSPKSILVGGAAATKLTGPNDGASCPTAASAFAPTVTTSAATSVTTSAARLNGSVNPNSTTSGNLTTVKFCYNTTNAKNLGVLTSPTCNTITTTAAPSNSPTSYYFDLTGLSSATYYFQIYGSNAGGEAYGSILSFTISSTTYSWQVTYDSNTADAGTMVVDSGTASSFTLSSNTFTKSGYTFNGWATSAGGGSPTYTDGQTLSIATNTTLLLYAQWSANAVPHTVTFYVNGGTGTSPATQTHTAAQALTSIATLGFTPPVNKVFDGWALHGTTTLIYADEDSYDFSSDLQLDAIWITPRILSFNPNGGILDSGLTVDTSTVFEGLNALDFSPAVDPTRTNYTFSGWALTDSATTGDAGPVLVPASDITLYAVWTSNATVTTVAASSITSTGASLNGTSTGTHTRNFFCWSTSSFDSTTADTSGGCGSATAAALTANSTPYTAALTGLTASTTYYFMIFGVSGGTLYAGTLLNFATSAAAPTYSPAPTLLVPVITWRNPASQVGPWKLSPTELNASCSVVGSTLTYNPALGVTLNPGTYVLTVLCTPPSGSAYGPLSTTVSFTVLKPEGKITWPTPAPVQGPAVLTPTELNAVCSIPGGTLTYDPARYAKLVPGKYTLKVTCTPPAGSFYSAVTSSVEFVVTVAPAVVIDPPSSPTMTLISGTSSTINWVKSPNANGYFLTLDDERVCITSALTCTIKKIVGPNSNLKIYGTKGDLRSTPVTPNYVRASQPQVIGMVFFDTAKFKIRPDQKEEIRRVAILMKKLGFTSVVIGGHTDSNAYDNLTLSNNRAKATRDALANLVPGITVDLHYSGSTSPMASNQTISGQAKNRRAEIAVW